VTELVFGVDAFSPEEARTTALHIAKWLKREKFNVQLESGLDDAPYRTTVRARSNQLEYLVEAQGTPTLSGGVGELATWLSVERKYAQLYIGVAATDDTVLSGRMIEQMKRQGIGLLVVDGAKNVECAFEARNAALVITPEPTLKFGHCKKEVGKSVARFNQGDRKAGLRDMCEIVEREMNTLTRKLAQMGWINRDEAAVRGMDFSSKINVAASQARYVGTRKPLVTDKLKHDLHSFRGARNLVDHPVENKREEVKRERQFPERMMMGPRLIAELVPLQRQVS